MIRILNDKTLSFLYNCSRLFCAAAREHKNQIFQHHVNEVEFDWDFLVNDENRSKIQQNITNRDSLGNIDKVVKLYNKLSQLQPDTEEFNTTKQQLMQQASDIPNLTHPKAPIGDMDQARTVSVHGKRNEFDFKPKSVVELGAMNEKLLQTSNVALFSGPRTYHLIKELADLESALVKYTFDYLMKKGFNILSVPDFVPTKDVERCGFKTSGLRNQVYKVAPNLCLSGTGEMSVASFLRDEVIPAEQLPMKLATVSRCYRAETSETEREKGLYRVHQFTKVEMFGVSESHQSDELLEEFLEHQINLFSGLNLHFRVLDMPSQELGAPAFRKYDVETWLPAKNFWGEISSASNCTDYQSRRLNVRCRSNAALNFCHTVNGTACAVPRMLIALMEANQQKDGSILLPDALIPYMGNKQKINCNKHTTNNPNK